ERHRTSSARWSGRPSFAAVLLGVLCQPLDRGDTFAFSGGEDDNALCGTAGDTDAVNRAADELATVGDQHDLIAFLDRKGRDQPAVLFGDRHGDDTFAAASSGAVLVGGGALAEALFRNREHELLGGRHFDVAALAKLDRALGLLLIQALLVAVAIAIAAAPHRVRPLQIGCPFLGRDIDMPEDRERNDFVAVSQIDSAHAHGRATLENAHVVYRKADALTGSRGEQHVVVFGANLHIDDGIAFIELHGDDPGPPYIGEIR